MDLRDLDSYRDEQDFGRWLDLLHPVTAEPTGIRLLIAGPDSKVQRDAIRRYHNALLAAQTKRGTIEAGKADDLYLDHLAEFVLDMDATEDGEKVPFSREAIGRVLRAGQWVRAQVEAFSQSRMAYETGVRNLDGSPVVRGADGLIHGEPIKPGTLNAKDLN